MMRRNKIAALAASLTLLALLAAGCAPKPTQVSPTPQVLPSEGPAQSEQPVSTPAGEKTVVNLAMLKGPTGIGAAKLLADNDAGSTRNAYAAQVAAQPSEVTGKLVSGDLDIAALPTNLAANLYHKSGGEVQLLALNTLGVLYILENGDTVHSLADLKGKTLYATGQGANPEYVLDYLLAQYGLDADKDLTLVWKSTGEEVAALMASGEAGLALLPVPAATGVLMQNTQVRTAVDLNAAWSAAGAGDWFPMGCVVVRTAFAQENPQAVEDFLTEYAASIDYVKSNPAQAAGLVAQYGITPSAAVAEAAIPQANLVCLTGLDLLSIQDYYEVLAGADPDSIGGSIPDGAFYYGVE